MEEKSRGGPGRCGFLRGYKKTCFFSGPKSVSLLQRQAKSGRDNPPHKPHDMPNPSDLTFVTNEDGQSLLERFKVLIRDTERFDALSGYFYSSGFHALCRSLEKTKRIRILIGIGSDKETAGWIESARQLELDFSHAEAQQRFSQKLVHEMDRSRDAKEVYEGALKFMEWLKSGKLEIRAYPSRRLHAKLYIMSFSEGDRDRGRVITGSSNFTRAGLIDNLEFNVELKNPSDYEFALQKFNELWEGAADLKETYLETARSKTWLNDTVTPYELYLKFLYEHFKEDLKSADESPFQYMPRDFKRLEYQTQAVQSAKRILEEHGGVFLSDVVGLGKTYMSAMLAGRLDGRSLVLAPPFLLDESNPGSWKNVFSDFRVPADFASIGQLEKTVSRGAGKYRNVFIDEAHRFRREDNITYENLARICRGKKVILATATPFNNAPEDILSQIKLFQPGKNSSIPNVPDLDRFFGDLKRRQKKLSKTENHAEYMRAAGEGAKKIRESVLKYLMVRRTRTEIEKYFAEDLKAQNVKFPEVKAPAPVYYQFNKEESAVFYKTARLVSEKFKYARYMPLTYYKNREQLDLQSQKNLGGFMRILLVKRLESSFHAFRNSISRFIQSYERFLEEFGRGHVYVSKDYSNQIFELLSNDDEEHVQKLIDEGRAKKYPSEDFSKDLEKDLKSDLEVLREIKSLWGGISRDPKLLAFADMLSPPSSDPAAAGAPEAFRPSALSQSKNLIVFTESKETAEYLGRELSGRFPNEVLVFTGSSSARVRDRIIQNFDPRASNPKDDCRILIATDVLSEGVNLHRSNVIVNYDLPWNPTRLMQRAGRINRVDTEFQEIRAFNFFPTEQSNDIIRLEETAKTKIEAFINMLGTDAWLLTEEEEPKSHRLFGRLGSKKAIFGEDEGAESELKYLKIIRDIRDKDPDLFSKIKQLPKKARTAKAYAGAESRLLTYFRRGKLNKFCIASGGSEAGELDFMASAKLLESEKTVPRKPLPGDFFALLDRNKTKFLSLTSEDEKLFSAGRSGRDSASELRKILTVIQKDMRQLTEDQEDYLKTVISRLQAGALNKYTAKTALKALEKELRASSGQPQPLKILGILQAHISDDLLKKHASERSAAPARPREVILSEYLIGKRNPAAKAYISN